MTIKMNQLSAGVLLAASAFAAPSYAAAVTDVVQAPSAYFLPVSASPYDSPYYRDRSQDWGWTHSAIAGAFTTASLSISAFDVDYSSGETDNIYALDSGDWVFLGTLTGSDGNWEYGNAFNLGSNFFDDIATGLQVKIDIDATNSGWVVTLGKSALSLDGGALPPPLPGVPEPSSWAMMIAGFGLVGASMRRRKSAAVTA